MRKFVINKSNVYAFYRKRTTLQRCRPTTKRYPVTTSLQLLPLYIQNIKSNKSNVYAFYRKRTTLNSCRPTTKRYPTTTLQLLPLCLQKIKRYAIMFKICTFSSSSRESPQKMHLNDYHYFTEKI